jgi:uridine phosphorylase
MIIVGDYERCNIVAECLSNVKRIESKRHFLTITGLYHDIPVSVVCGGMGMSITDFTIREARQVLQGPMAIVRFGSCGVVHEDVNVGDIIVPESSIMVQQNFFDDSGPFLLSKPAFADKELIKLIVNELNTTSSKYFRVATGGMVASTDSFYASQGKIHN